MRYHFSINYSGDFEPISKWLLQRAAADPLVAIMRGPRGYYHLVFTDSPEFAERQQQQFDAGSGAYTGVCPVEVIPEHGMLGVNLECGNAERDAAASFLDALFKEFPNYTVYDSDTGENITDEAKSNPQSLFY